MWDEKKYFNNLYMFFNSYTCPSSSSYNQFTCIPKTDNIKQSQQSLLDNKNKISETGNAIKYHASIIQDTINGMNNVIVSILEMELLYK
ncbi:MAG: hypothetical protein PHY59_03485 [Methanobacterium sp.]|nr:hypothetical protein [Methanobacterium sp.]